MSATGTLAADAVRFASIIYRNYLPSTTKRSPPIPYKPALNPIDNLHHQSNYLVDWLPVDLADTYTLQEANDPDFNETITQYSGTSYSWSAIDKTINTYYYRVKASNLWGDSSWSDIQHTTVLPPTGWQTITSQNFESTFPDKWRAFDNNGSSNGEYYWGSRTCKPYNDNYSGWGIGGGTDGEDLTCGSNYPHNLDSWLIYGPFNLENAIASELTFKLWLYSESENDWAFHGASKNGINFYSYATSGNTQGWVNKNLDLANIPTLGNLLGEPEIWITLIFHWTLAFFDFATICCVRTSCLTTTGGTDF